jgi:hypothetical protein
LNEITDNAKFTQIQQNGGANSRLAGPEGSLTCTQDITSTSSPEPDKSRLRVHGESKGNVFFVACLTALLYVTALNDRIIRE